MKKSRFFLFFLLFFFIPSRGSAAEIGFYFFPDKNDYKEVFVPRLLALPSESYPVVFILPKKSKNIDSIIPFLVSHGSKWVLPLSESKEKFFLAGRGIDDFVYSGDLAKHFYFFDKEKTGEFKQLFISLKIKKSNLNGSVYSLNKILSLWKKNDSSEIFFKFDKLISDFHSSKLSLEQFMGEFFPIMDELKINIGVYPKLMFYRDRFLKKDGKIKTPDITKVKYEQELFNSEITDLSSKLDIDDIQFFSKNVISNNLNLFSYQKFMLLMAKLGIPVKAKYPEYLRYLYYSAWREEMKKESFFGEINDAIRKVRVELLSHEDTLVRDWIVFVDTLSKFIGAEITYSDYKILSKPVLSFGSRDSQEKNRVVLDKISAVWTDFEQKKLSDALDVFNKYVNFSGTDESNLKKAIAKDQSNMIILVGEEADVQPWLYWFSKDPVGALLKVVPIEPDEEGETRYFELMRGEKSHFEKLLNGIGDD